MYCNINLSDNFLKLSAELVPADIQLFLNIRSVHMTLNLNFMKFMISEPLQQSFEVRKKWSMLHFLCSLNLTSKLFG
jgi:hypothetical protein